MFFEAIFEDAQQKKNDRHPTTTNHTLSRVRSFQYTMGSYLYLCNQLDIVVCLLYGTLREGLLWALVLFSFVSDL